MNKLIAKRDFRHGSQRIKEGQAFEASPRDTEYYMQFGYAVAQEGAQIEQPSRRLYGRKDMQAEDMHSVAISAEGKNEAQARAQAMAQQNATQARRRGPRATAMTTQNTGALTDAQPPVAADSVASAPAAPVAPVAPAPTPAVPGVVSTPENPVPAQSPEPAAPQPAPNVASGDVVGTVSTATGSAHGHSGNG